MTTYQDVVRANGAVVSWALAEASGLAFAPWLGWAGLTGTGLFDYQQPGPVAASISLGLHTGAKLAANLLQTPSVPWTLEFWFYIPSSSFTASTISWFFGTPSANGAGMIFQLSPLQHVWWEQDGGHSIGVPLSTDGWHLLTVSVTGNGSFTLFIDGQPQFGTGVPAWNAPSPNVIFFGGSGSTSAASPWRIAYPAIYSYAMQAPQAYATFLAASDPASALAYTQRGAASGAISDSQLLAEIYAAVHKVW